MQGKECSLPIRHPLLEASPSLLLNRVVVKSSLPLLSSLQNSLSRRKERVYAHLFLKKCIREPPFLSFISQGRWFGRFQYVYLRASQSVPLAIGQATMYLSVGKVASLRSFPAHSPRTGFSYPFSWFLRTLEKRILLLKAFPEVKVIHSHGQWKGNGIWLIRGLLKAILVTPFSREAYQQGRGLPCNNRAFFSEPYFRIGRLDFLFFIPIFRLLFRFSFISMLIPSSIPIKERNRVEKAGGKHWFLRPPGRNWFLAKR